MLETVSPIFAYIVDCKPLAQCCLQEVLKRIQVHMVVTMYENGVPKITEVGL
jgi:hypothetical protein